jgi:hypothetical protein
MTECIPVSAAAEDINQQPPLDFPDRVVRRLVMQQLADTFAQLCQAGFAFEPWLASIEDHRVYDIGRNTSFPLHPSHYWTHHNGRQAVDFIGKVENFESDFTKSV